MRKAAIAIVVVGVGALLVIGLVQAGGKDSASTSPPGPLSRAEVSEPLPGAPAELAALRARVNEINDGGVKAFDAQLRALRGRPVVVNLWASWCGPCRFELPFFQKQALQRGDEVAFLGVNVGDTEDAAREFAAEFPMPYPSFADPDQKLLGRFGAQGLPVTAFYDASGELEFLHQGLYPNEEKLAEAIERYARS
ncbi:MAG: TlpA family protein disulfide reductase [Solirubrobacterales bacterium]|nr:TlpA family protein disulfide reductase [Solirubrobacterales bacterium]